MRQQHHHQERGAWMIKPLIYALCIRASTSALDSIYVALPSCNNNGRRSSPEAVSCPSCRMVSGNNKVGTMGRCVFLHLLHCRVSIPLDSYWAARDSLHHSLHHNTYATCVFTDTPLRLSPTLHSSEWASWKKETHLDLSKVLSCYFFFFFF